MKTVEDRLADALDRQRHPAVTAPRPQPRPAAPPRAAVQPGAKLREVVVERTTPRSPTVRKRAASPPAVVAPVPSPTVAAPPPPTLAPSLPETAPSTTPEPACGAIDPRTGLVCIKHPTHRRWHLARRADGTPVPWPKTRDPAAVARARAVVEARGDEIRAMLAASIGADGLWRIDIDKAIARALHVPRAAVHWYITRELRAGRLVNPRVALGLDRKRRPAAANLNGSPREVEREDLSIAVNLAGAVPLEVLS
jgi:hypothetical protein